MLRKFGLRRVVAMATATITTISVVSERRIASIGKRLRSLLVVSLPAMALMLSLSLARRSG